MSKKYARYRLEEVCWVPDLHGACKMENNVPLGISRMRVFNNEGNLHFDRPRNYPDLKLY